MLLHIVNSAARVAQLRVRRSAMGEQWPADGAPLAEWKNGFFACCAIKDCGLIPCFLPNAVAYGCLQCTYEARCL